MNSLDKMEDYDRLLKENEQLKRRSAEQQAWIVALVEGLLSPIAHYPDIEFDPIKLSRIADGFGQTSVNFGKEELNNLLAKAKEESTCHPAACRDEMLWRAELAKAKEEGRREAVPEGWQIVPKAPTRGMTAAFNFEQVDYNSISDRLFMNGYKAMLSAAPKLEGTTE